MSKTTKVAFRLIDLLVIFVMTFGSPMSAAAYVWTDPTDYPPGATVTIRGDNSDTDNDHNFWPNEAVHVDVVGPNGGDLLACDAVADGNGAWQCDVTISSDPALAVGEYTYTATGLTSGNVETGTFTDDAPPSPTNLNQCDPPTGYNPTTYTCASAGATGWVTGNNDGPYTEGETIPYRIGYDNLIVGHTYSVTIEWDTTKSSKHALDYLKAYNATILAANPCDGMSNYCTGAPISLAIPADTFMQSDAAWIANSGVQDPGNFTFYGISDPSASAYTTPANYSGDTSTSITVTFTATSSKVLMAWGGHIAERDDWGFGYSAVSITGSPYHMRFLTWKDATLDEVLGGGNQDRSLSAEAVIYPAEIKIIKDAIPDDPQDFPFTTTGLVPPLASPGSFTLDDDTDPAFSNFKDITNILSFGAKTVTEASVDNWPLYALSCTVNPVDPTQPSTWTADLITQVVSIDLKEGDYVECTFTDKMQKVNPTVTTTLHKADHTEVAIGGSVDLGTVMHDLATVSGSNGIPTGNVSFSFYTTNDCTGDAQTAGTVALDGAGVADPSTAFGPLAAGSYSFKAHYEGSSSYFAADSACEPFTVNKAQLGITTVVHDGSHTDITNQSVPLGTSAHDNATVTGAVSGFIIPAISFTFNGSAIANDATETGFDATSVSTGALGAGSYKFNATVGSNDNYIGATSADEPFTVNKQATTTTTEIHLLDESVVSGPVPLGSTVHDQATVVDSGKGTPTGTVTFYWFTNNTCEGTGTNIGMVTLVNGIAHPSANQEALHAGYYAFKAHYNGDTNYSESDSACEPFSVTKATPTISTTLKNAVDNSTIPINTALVLGTSVYDTSAFSSLNGAFSPDGTAKVTYQFFKNSACTGDPFSTQDVTVAADGTVPNSSATGSLGYGSYAFRAVYGGNDNYNGATSDCEPFSVNKAQLGITTTVHSDVPDAPLVGNLPLGGGAHDSATVTGQVNDFALPSVTFYFFDKGVACTSGNTTGSIALNTLAPDVNGVAHPSWGFAGLGAGTYNFMAKVADNDNYIGATSDCEPFTINQAQLGITTTVHSNDPDTPLVGNLPLGGGAHDSATVTGTVEGFPPPNVTFYFFDEGVACINGNTTGGTALNTIAPNVSTGIAHPSTWKTNLGAGTYNFMAKVAGNDHYLGATSDCEPFTVNQGIATITTAIHRGTNHTDDIQNTNIDIGSKIHDSVNVAGDVAYFVPSGTVDFYYFANKTCGGEPVDPSLDQTLVNGALDNTAFEKGPLEAGDYSFKVHYDGDTNYPAGDATCEWVHVNKGYSGMTTTLHKADDSVVNSDGSVPLGTVMHDLAQVNPNSYFAPTGNVNFTFFNNGTCTGLGADAWSVALDGKLPGVAHPSNSFGPLAADSYAFRASWAGDSNYNGAISPCEPFTVDKATPTITTQVHDSNHNDVTNTVVAAGTPIHDSAALGGQVGSFSFNGTATVTYNFYTNSTCTGTPTTEVVTVNADGTVPESAVKSNLGPGPYCYQAVYSGNANYNEATSAIEPFTVIQKSIVTNTELCTFDVDSGTAGDQFRLVFTPDQDNQATWKLNASNPGQFYYNIFDNNPTGEMTITLPYPFVTQGATAIHVYSSVTTQTVNGETCLIPGDEIAIDHQAITLSSYDPQAFGSKASVTINYSGSPTGFVYVNIHVDYGLKGTTGYSKDGNNNAVDALNTSTILIQDYENYTFSVVNGITDSATVSSHNVFKRDPGVGGLVLKQGSNQPVANVQVDIYQGNKKIATVYTDDDGWYMFQYKYTGKPITFTAKLPKYGLSQSQTMKSNKFLHMNFIVP